jgi:N-acetylglucosamine kinase
MIYGIDIGGTKIEFAIYNQQLQLINSYRIPTPTEDYGVFIDTLVTLIKQADLQFACKGQIGLGMPGLIDADGFSLCANVVCSNGKNVAKDLAARLNRPIAIENDCRCFALSEATGGAGASYQHVYGAIIGTGAAGGLVINGHLYKGRQAIAGEHGHFALPAALQQKYQLPIKTCGCGLNGCFEGYVAGPGISFLFQHFGGQPLSVPELVTLWRRGDHTASKTFECYIDLLAANFANLVLAYDPEVIVVGGGISLIPEILQSLPSAINCHLFAKFTAPPIVCAKFGDASGVRGAAILASQLNYAK